MDILNNLNLEYEIEERNGIFYDMQICGEIIANSKKELIQFYIEDFKYKIEMLFNCEIEAKKHYINVIKQLERLAQ